VKEEPKRPLDPNERRVLDLLLRNEVPGAAELRKQAAAVTVVGRCECGCPTVDLAVPKALARAPSAGNLFSIEARVAPLGDEPTGDIILFLEGGVLSSLEYVFYTNNPPDDWPSSDRLSLLEFPDR